MPQTIAIRILMYVGAALILFSAGVFLGYRYDHRAFDSYKNEQALIAQREKDAAVATALHDKEVQSEIDAKDQQDLAGYAGYINQLLQSAAHKTGPGNVRSASAGAPNPGVAANGPATRGPDPVLQCPAAEDTRASDNVTLDALIQLRSWRHYARQTGQAK